MTDQLEITAKIQIRKPVAEVFEAIVDPQKMSGYFISAGTGRMETGKEVKWSWPEFEGQFPVKVQKAGQEFISFLWESGEKELLVEIKLEPRENNSTLVTVTEKSMENNEAGLKWLKGNTEGWANFLACLKAYLEYGINLREGAFDFMRK